LRSRRALGHAPAESSRSIAGHDEGGTPLSRESGRLINRELSWLDFDRRVLSLAEDSTRPLLERAKFLAIFSRNLDEFFQVRVSGLQDAEVLMPGGLSPDGLTPSQQLLAIRERVLDLGADAQSIWSTELRPALCTTGIEILPFDELDAEERQEMTKRFRERIQPVLVPFAIDSSHPFPYVSGLSLNVGALVRRRGGGPERFARVKVPPLLDRWWDTGSGRFVAVEELVEAHLDLLFPNDEILQQGHFRVTRDADLELASQNSNDLAESVEAGLRRRQRGSDAVRLEADAVLGPRIRRILVEQLELKEDEVYDVDGLLDLGGLIQLYRLERPELKDVKWTPRPMPALAEASNGDLFKALREAPRLVHHPYESFESSVERFLRAASEDEHVHVIMVSIYRTGGEESGIVRALESAAARGKQVVVLVELKARFDEASNLERARALERAGAHVVYGLAGLKTHAKIALVVRQEQSGFRRYCHVGTGNYNPDTARLYEDLGLLSADPALTLDVAELFHRLTSSSAGRRYTRLLVAPEALRDAILERIAAEAAAPDGRIVMKLNNLADQAIIEALYAASRAGVEIDLIVRSICCLRPGVAGMSPTIRVRSILGRFLEHSRILRFGSEARGVEVFIGSADLMPRNLDLRVEALVPVEDPGLQARLESILHLLLHPEAQAWSLGPDGVWSPGGGELDVQAVLQEGALA
jgi:polyphosphate kinase